MRARRGVSFEPGLMPGVAEDALACGIVVELGSAAGLGGTFCVGDKNDRIGVDPGDGNGPMKPLTFSPHWL